MRGLEPHPHLSRWCPDQLDQHGSNAFILAYYVAFTPSDVVQRVGLEPTCTGEGQLGPATNQYVNLSISKSEGIAQVLMLLNTQL